MRGSDCKQKVSDLCCNLFVRFYARVRLQKVSDLCNDLFVGFYEGIRLQKLVIWTEICF